MEVRAAQEGLVSAPANEVYDYLADYSEHHPKILPANFSDLRIESGGRGAGTVVTFRLKPGGVTRSYRSALTEPEPGLTLTETDTSSGAVTTLPWIQPAVRAACASRRGGSAREYRASSSACSLPEY